MKLSHLPCALVLVFSACFASAAISATEIPQARIINGHSATQDYDFFTTLMLRDQFGAPGEHHWKPFCAGSYIGSGTVVTAAHCMAALGSDETFAVLVGNYSDQMAFEYCADADYDCITRSSKEECVPSYHYTGYVVYTGPESEFETMTVSDSSVDSSVIINSNYSSNQLTNDIALIQLATHPARGAINLPESTDAFAMAAGINSAYSVRVLGHGDTISDRSNETFEGSPELLEVNITPRTDSVCSQAMDGFNPSTMVCAGDVNRDSCQGDSGGPLFDPLTNTLLGIVSWGAVQCGSNRTGEYGVYSDVFALTGWIKVNRSASLAAPRSVALATSAQIDPPRTLAPRLALTDACEVSVGSLGTKGEVYRLGNDAPQGGSSGLWLLIASVGLLLRRRP